jgi:hypothetical protein
MKPSLLITFIVAAVFTAIGIIAGIKEGNMSAVVWAFCTLIWISAALHTRIDIETQKRVNNVQEEIIKTQEDLIKTEEEIIRIQKDTIKNQKEIIKELEQKQ